MVLIGGGAERLNRRQWRQLARMSAHFLDALQGLTTLKLFNASRREAQLIARISDDYRKSTMSVLRVAFLSALALEFFATVSIAVVAVLIGFRLLHAQMGFEAGFFILLLAPEFYLPLRTLGAHYHARMEAIGAAERIVEVLDAPLAAHGTDARARPLLGRDIEIRFEDVHYAYEPGREALRGASFSARGGARHGLGRAQRRGQEHGAQCAARLRARAARTACWSAGTISIQLDPDHWLSHVAWVPQRPHLFRGSVLDNIRMFDGTIGFEAVRAAARQAHAEEFIERLPQGYDTEVGERGQNLSGGQVQRLALARAFLKDAPVLLMDEATSSLDPETEALITEAIARLAQARTVLVIAHRLRTVRNADCIVVMDGGRVVEQGTHEDLLRADGRYARMVRAHEPEALAHRHPEARCPCCWRGTATSPTPTLPRARGRIEPDPDRSVRELATADNANMRDDLKIFARLLRLSRRYWAWMALGRAALHRHRASQYRPDGGCGLVPRRDGRGGRRGHLDQLLSALGFDPAVRDTARWRALSRTAGHARGHVSAPVRAAGVVLPAPGAARSSAAAALPRQRSAQPYPGGHRYLASRLPARAGAGTGRRRRRRGRRNRAEPVQLIDSVARPDPAARGRCGDPAHHAPCGRALRCMGRRDARRRCVPRLVDSVQGMGELRVYGAAQRQAQRSNI